MKHEASLEHVVSEIDGLVGNDQFSGNILLTKDGQILFSRSSGFADRENRISNNIDTKFNLGSLNKMFTSVAIAQLAEKGALQFDHPLSLYLSDYPNSDVKKVTIHQLLTHTGGTGDIFGPEFSANLENLKEIKDYIRLYGRRDLIFPPGSQYTYSNYGYMLLGAIIEHVTGQKYDDIVEQNIFHKAGMNSTKSFWKTKLEPNTAIGYMRTQEGLKNNFDTLPVFGTPTGGGYSTVGDITRFAQALLSNKLLNANYTKIVTDGKVDTSDGQQYAYGFRVIRKNGHLWFGHSGGAPGMNATTRILPHSKHIIAILSNFDVPTADNVAEMLLKAIL